MKAKITFKNLSKPNRNGYRYSNPQQLVAKQFPIVTCADDFDRRGFVDIKKIIGFGDTCLDGDDLIVDATLIDTFTEVYGSEPRFSLSSVGDVVNDTELSVYHLNGIVLTTDATRDQTISFVHDKDAKNEIVG